MNTETFVNVTPEILHMLGQIAKASEENEMMKVELDGTTGKHYTGQWAKINQAKNRKLQRSLAWDISQNDKLIAALNKKIESHQEMLTPSYDKTEAQVDAELLEMLLS